MDKLERFQLEEERRRLAAEKVRNVALGFQKAIEHNKSKPRVGTVKLQRIL